MSIQPIDEFKLIALMIAGAVFALTGLYEVATILDDQRAAAGNELSTRFLEEEWRLVIDPWGICDPDTYRDLPRVGRRVRVPTERRDAIWQIMAGVYAELGRRCVMTEAMMFHALARHLRATDEKPYDHIIVDEAQDVSVDELTFLAAADGSQADGLFFAGDIGQRIFRSPFSWASLGVEIRGRSRSLKVNYRTSQQIRQRTEQLLPPRLVEVDGSEENRAGVVSVFEGPDPTFVECESDAEEIELVGRWLAARLAEGTKPEEVGLFVRTTAQFDRAKRAVVAAGAA